MPRVPELPTSPLQAGCLWGAIVGTAGFVAGFFGPMILVPSANQGPLLGILITGPVGAAVGFAGGAVMALVRGHGSRG